MITRPLAATTLLVALTAPLGGQDLSGMWQSGSPRAGEITLMLQQDSAGVVTGTLTVAGRIATVRGVVRGGVLRGTAERDGIAERIEARLLGESLLWRVEGLEGEEYALQRLGQTAVTPGDSVASGSFAGTWVGEGVLLVLEEGDGAYSGTLTVAGVPWSVLARARGPVLICTIASGGETRRLTATLSGDVLMLSGRAASAPLKRAPADSVVDR